MTDTPRDRPPEPALSARAVDALLVDTTPWLSCDECFERMDLHVEALLADPHHRDDAMDHHLQGCAACADEARSLLDLLRSGTL
ncbi:hypothetical protein [Terrabacter terrigena]|uniref:Zinc-finger domain-containing protein n=1 Tax=Terrabacter terrigena TaxID=574718 RepID=A0ABW3MVE4_9MICO